MVRNRSYANWLLALAVSLVGIVPACAEPPAATASPSVSITLGPRQGHVTPIRQGFTHTGGGNIQVAQPTPDTVVVTMTGAALAGAHPFKNSVAGLQFDLVQSFEISSTD